MSTTTVINPDKDTYLNEGSGGNNNYGTVNHIVVGRFTKSGVTVSMDAVFEFDLTSLPDATAVYSATLNLVELSSTGAASNLSTLSRLGIGFVESGAGGCTWEYADTTDTDTAWTGGADYAEDYPPPISFNVGAAGGTQALDVKEFVIDAVLRRASILRIVIVCPSGAAGQTKFGSSRHATSGNRPTLEVVTATRIRWRPTVAGLPGRLTDLFNWYPQQVPTASDYAYFTGSGYSISGSPFPLNGTLTAANVYIGKKHRENFGTSSTAITVTADNILYSSPYCEANLDVNSGRGIDGTVRIGNTNQTADTVKFSGETTYRLINTQSPVVIAGSAVSGIECHSAGASFTVSGTVTSVKVTGGGGRLQNGAASIYSVAASLLIENTDYTTTDLTQIGGFTKILADTMGDIIIYAGTLSVRGNQGAPITLTNLTLYLNSLADLRTKSNTIVTTNPVTMYGGRVLLDGNVDATIA